MDEFIPRTSWLRDLPDDTLVTALSIPGTHNSGCIGGLFGFTQTQNLELSDQLDAGIRFLDIRLTRCQGNLCVHHNAMCMDKKYTDILAICSNFLKKHPSETILMSVKDEGRLDCRPGRSTPSRILQKLSTGNATEGGRETSSFEGILKARTREHAANAPLFYNFATRSSDGDSMTMCHTLTSETTLGEVRGKIVLLRRFEGSQEIGLDLTYWPENQTFRSAAPPIYDVHDRYHGLADEDKYELVVTHIEEANHGDPEDLYITFSSAVDLKADGYAETINPRLSDYLAEISGGRVGIIVMDYFEKPSELVSNVIKMNQQTC